MYFIMILVFLALLALCWFGLMATTRQADSQHALSRANAQKPPASGTGAPKGDSGQGENVSQRSATPPAEPANPIPGKPASAPPDSA